MRADPRRQAALAKINVAKRLLRLSDDLYRAIIARVTGGKRSSATLGPDERRRLLAELDRLGFAQRSPHQLERAASGTSLATAPTAGTAASGPAHEPHAAAQARMIRTLWRRLGKAATLRNGSERGLRLFIRRQTGRDALQWLTAAEANQVIEGLKAWQRRVRSGG